MTIENILLISVCCVGLIFLQILKYYIIRCHTLERKLKVLNYHSKSSELFELPDLNNLVNKKMSPTITAVGRPTINTNLATPSSILGNNVENSAKIMNASASRIAKIIPSFANVLKVITSRVRTSLNKEQNLLADFLIPITPLVSYYY